MAKKISEILNLEKAYNEMLHDDRHGQDFLPDILHFLDTRKSKQQLLHQLKEDIDNNRFQVNDLIKMDVPKDSFFIRPGARPCLKDLVLYRALANYIGLKTDKKLGPNVFSSRFDHRKGQLNHWRDQHLKFERAFWVNFERGFKYVLETDITAYFANIDIERRLRNFIMAMLDKSEESERIVNFLFDNLIRPWAEKERNKGFGLPQGGNASPILANLFLSHIDAVFARNKNLRYLRYSDDIRILAKSEIEAKIALRTLIGELRRIGLDLNEKKTQILNPSQVEQLRDPRRQDMDTLQTILNFGNKDLIKKFAMPLLNDLFERSFDASNTFGDTHLRFSINCFVRLREIYKGRAKDIEAIGLKLIDKLESMPGSTDTFSRFFSVFPQHRFKRELVKFLKGESNIYEWQEMWILDRLLRFDSFSQAELRVFGAIAFDREHPLVRSKAILLVGKFGDEHERYQLMTRFNEETHYLVKRAIIVATQELSNAERNDFYATVKRTDQEQAELVDYIKSLRERVYFDEFVPAAISPIDEQY